MQGAFAALGADWQAALDPGVDDEAQRQQRSDAIDRQLRVLTHIRNPQAPGPLPPDPLAYSQPYPPTPHFQVDEKTFYILKGPLVEDELARAGMWGHYLVTTVDITATPGFARPIDVKIEIPPGQRVLLPHAPGTEIGDSRLAPDQRFCIGSVHYIVPSPPGPTPAYYEIGLHALKVSLEKAEALDLAFARRMEGLGNVAPQVCLIIPRVALTAC